ncbi:hypothetical protein JG688_00013946, partial [Phytophthora aleatoria]
QAFKRRTRRPRLVRRPEKRRRRGSCVETNGAGEENVAEPLSLRSTDKKRSDVHDKDAEVCDHDPNTDRTLWVRRTKSNPERVAIETSRVDVINKIPPLMMLDFRPGTSFVTFWRSIAAITFCYSELEILGPFLLRWSTATRPSAAPMDVRRNPAVKVSSVLQVVTLDARPASRLPGRTSQRKGKRKSDHRKPDSVPPFLQFIAAQLSNDALTMVSAQWDLFMVNKSE